MRADIEKCGIRKWKIKVMKVLLMEGNIGYSYECVL